MIENDRLFIVGTSDGNITYFVGNSAYSLHIHRPLEKIEEAFSSFPAHANFKFLMISPANITVFIFILIS